MWERQNKAKNTNLKTKGVDRDEQNTYAFVSMQTRVFLSEGSEGREVTVFQHTLTFHLHGFGRCWLRQLRLGKALIA